jgi:AraC family transcriptional regulator
MSVLPLGQYYGRVPRRWSAESLALSVVVHDAERVNAPHGHEAAFVTLMLDGQYRERAAQRTFEFDRFTALYHPPDLDHQDFIGAPGVRLLLFEFRPDLLEGAGLKRGDVRSVRDLSGSLTAWELLSLYRDAGDGDALEFESRAMELIGRLAPVARNIPRDLRSLERAREHLRATFRQPVTLRQVASAAGVHPVYLGQAFHREFGETIGGHVARLRVRAAAQQLTTTDAPLAAIAFEHGFCDQSHFHRVFRKLSGFTPAEFRQSFSAHSRAL